ncbi:rab3 GTPase-activating protein catalytic subunit-like [Astatotilapia calliptera]|uniref:rab3 GTPase-activating protein catalytic subunit-like n=1 Tax=Astatotilapia calliptera TaxID=8154 RepID=UPI000E40A01B|nr:rab3 GTPase-activating protein catalytic subunit-like [Astatotilapia calliptera]
MLIHCFVSRVEEVLNDWKLTGNTAQKVSPEKGEYTSGTWAEKSQEINFADFKFYISHYFLKQECEEDDGKDNLEEDAIPLAMQDLLCMNNDFPPRAHCLVRWFGIREFVVISPGTNCEAVISESKCNLLLSSISISLANSGCQVPMFVQIQQKWRRMYAGECKGPGVRTDFEIVHLRRAPVQYNHLSGLLDIFKSKIGCSLFPLPPVNIAIRFTYVLQDWQQYSWPQQPPDFDALLGGEVGGVEFGKFPFGACEEPISELHLATTWPHLIEGIVVDNDVYSDLDPLQAPHWSVRVRTAENPQCLLGEAVTELFKLCCRTECTEEIPGRGYAEDEGKENSDISSALSKLTEPAATVPISKLSVSNMVHSARKHIRRHRRIDESPLNTEILNSVLLTYLFVFVSLFPDAAVEKSDCKNNTQLSNSSGTSEQEKTSDFNLFHQLKSAPSDSLTYRLALCVCLFNYYYGGLRAVAVKAPSGGGTTWFRALPPAAGDMFRFQLCRLESLFLFFICVLLFHPFLLPVSCIKLADFTTDEGVFGDVEAALLAPVDEDLGSDKKQTGGSSRVPDFPPPAGREILLRTCVPRPAAYSKALPQRLFCVLMREEFRLTGGFSTDTSSF